MPATVPFRFSPKMDPVIFAARRRGRLDERIDHAQRVFIALDVLQRVIANEAAGWSSPAHAPHSPAQ